MDYIPPRQRRSGTSTNNESSYIPPRLRRQKTNTISKPVEVEKKGPTPEAIVDSMRNQGVNKVKSYIDSIPNLDKGYQKKLYDYGGIKDNLGSKVASGADKVLSFVGSGIAKGASAAYNTPVLGSSLKDNVSWWTGKPEEAGSFAPVKATGQKIGKGLGKGLELLDRPRNVIATGLKEKSLEGVIKGITGEEKTLTADIMPKGYQDFTKKYPAIGGVSNFGLELASDPTTYIGAGVVKKVVKEVGENILKQAVKQTAKKELTNVLKTVEKGIPFTKAELKKAGIGLKLQPKVETPKQINIGNQLALPAGKGELRRVGVGLKEQPKVNTPKVINATDGKTIYVSPEGIASKNAKNVPQLALPESSVLKNLQSKEADLTNKINFISVNKFGIPKTINEKRLLEQYKSQLVSVTNQIDELNKAQKIKVDMIPSTVETPKMVSPKEIGLNPKLKNLNIEPKPQNVNPYKGETPILDRLAQNKEKQELVSQRVGNQKPEWVKNVENGIKQQSIKTKNNIDEIARQSKDYNSFVDEFLNKMPYTAEMKQSLKRNNFMKDVYDKVQVKKPAMPQVAVTPQYKTPNIAKELQNDEVYNEITKELKDTNTIPDENISVIAKTIKDKSGLTLNIKDVSRNMRDAFGKNFEYVKKKYLDTFDASKKAYVDEVKASTDNIYNNVVKRLGIKKGSKESAAVQNYGEKKKLIGTKQAIDPQTGTKITTANEIAYTLNDLKKDFPNKWQNIVEADGIFRKNYDEFIDKINETVKRIYPNNPAKLVPKRADYYRHFREMEELFPGVRNMFETSAQIDPRLVGISEFTKPNTKWASFKQKRGLGEYKADAVGGFLDYVGPASYAIHIDPHVSSFRSLAKDIAEATVKSKNANNTIKYLNDFANSLAGKTNKYDRLLQEDLGINIGNVRLEGRQLMRILNWTSSRVKRNQVLANASSALSQIANVPLGVAKIKNPVHLAQGVGDTLASITGKVNANKLYKQSQFLSERYMSDLTSRFEERWIKQPEMMAGWVLGKADELGTKFIWNSSYRQAIAKGIENPIKYADEITRGLVAGRGIGEVPLLQQSKVFQLVAPFQLEVANMWHVLGDMGKQKDFAGIASLMLGNYLFNNITEQATGNRVTFDPIDAMVKSLTEEDTNAIKVGGRLAGEALSNVPLGQTLATLYPENKTTISSPFGEKTLPSRKDFFGDNDPTRFGGGLLVAKAVTDPFYKLALPFGGAQLKKTVEGNKALQAKGVYQDSKDGKQLKYPVNPTMNNKIKGNLFGKNALDETRDYYNNDRRPLGVKQTEAFDTLRNEQGVDQTKLYNALNFKRGIDTVENKIRNIYKQSDVPMETKVAQMKDEIKKQYNEINNNKNYTPENKALMIKLLEDKIKSITFKND